MLLHYCLGSKVPDLHYFTRFIKLMLCFCNQGLPQPRSSVFHRTHAALQWWIPYIVWIWSVSRPTRWPTSCLINEQRSRPKDVRGNPQEEINLWILFICPVCVAAAVGFQLDGGLGGWGGSRWCNPALFHVAPEQQKPGFVLSPSSYECPCFSVILLSTV